MVTVAPPNRSTMFARPGTGPTIRGCRTAGARIVVARGPTPNEREALADGDLFGEHAGEDAGFEAICDDLADRIGAARKVVEGAGHEIQFTGPPINEALLELWRTE